MEYPKMSGPYFSLFTLLVHDYDEAIDFFVNKLGFILVEDTKMSPEKRWVIVRPKGGKETGLILAKAGNEQQSQGVGNQGFGRVLLFVHTDDFDRDYASMKAAGVEFCEEPRNEVYGKVVVFKDLYGNKYDFIQRK
eukprot:Colp12_sorted_trinity150504_noHs@27234